MTTHPDDVTLRSSNPTRAARVMAEYGKDIESMGLGEQDTLYDNLFARLPEGYAPAELDILLYRTFNQREAKDTTRRFLRNGRLGPPVKEGYEAQPLQANAIRLLEGAQD